MQVAKYQCKYPGMNSALMGDKYRHIDHQKRLDAEEGRNPSLWILFCASVSRHNRKGLIRVFKKSHPDYQGKKSSPELKCMLNRLLSVDNKKAASNRRMARLPKLSQNTFILGFEHLPLMPDRQARQRTSAPGSRAVITDSGGGGPDDPDPDPDPERPYIALGIDHKATTPAGPPLFAVLRPFTDPNTVTARLCRHEYTRHHHPEP